MFEKHGEHKMSELTIILSSFGHKDLKDYLLSLDGVSKVKIENERYLKIDVKYDSKKIASKVIKMEITLFLNLLKTPSLLAFDKHSPESTENYQIIKKEPFCEICIASAMDRLFEMDGIEKVESSYNYIDDATSAEQKLVLNIFYNPNVLQIKDMKKIEETMKS